jgi:hypothetical protein
MFFERRIETTAESWWPTFDRILDPTFFAMRQKRCHAALNSRNMMSEAVFRHLNSGIRRAACTQILE